MSIVCSPLRYFSRTTIPALITNVLHLVLRHNLYVWVFLKSDNDCVLSLELNQYKQFVFCVFCVWGKRCPMPFVYIPKLFIMLFMYICCTCMHKTEETKLHALNYTTFIYIWKICREWKYEYGYQVQCQRFPLHIIMFCLIFVECIIWFLLVHAY